MHGQMAVSVAVAVDCARRLRTFAQKVPDLRAKPKFLMHVRPFIIQFSLFCCCVVVVVVVFFIIAVVVVVASKLVLRR